jgi:hypothetical protein
MPLCLEAAASSPLWLTPRRLTPSRYSYHTANRFGLASEKISANVDDPSIGWSALDAFKWPALTHLRRESEARRYPGLSLFGHHERRDGSSSRWSSQYAESVAICARCRICSAVRSQWAFS